MAFAPRALRLGRVRLAGHAVRLTHHRQQRYQSTEVLARAAPGAELEPEPSDGGSSSDIEASDMPPAGVASKALREITLALAPPTRPFVELPAQQVEDLEELYDMLMRPLPPLPTQAERVEKRRAVVEAEDASAFFALPGQDALDAESHAHRIRCLGAQGKLAAAHAALQEMRDAHSRSAGPPPDQACLHALADACARAGDVDGVEAVIQEALDARMPMNAPYFTSLIGAHRRS